MATDGLPVYGGNIQYNYASGFDFLKPNIALEVSKRYGNGIKVTDVLYAAGRIKPVDRTSWSVYEENKFHRTITLGANSTTGNSKQSTPITCWKFKLSANDLDSNGRFYPRVGMHVLVPIAHAVYSARIDWIEDNSGIYLYCVPMDSGVTPSDDDVVSGTELTIFTHSAAAGTGQPSAVSQGYTKRTFYTQIIKESIKADGSSLTDATWFSKFDDGKKILNWYSPEFDYAESRLNIYEEGMILFGEKAQSGITQTAYGTRYGYTETEGLNNHIQTSQGLFDWNADVGGQLNYSDNNWSIDDLDTIEDHLVGEGVNSGIILHLIGRNLKRQVNDAGLDLVNASSAGDQLIKQYLGSDGTTEMGISLGFKVFERDGFKHIFQICDSFTNPQTYGASGYEIKKWGFSLPVSNVNVMDSNKKKVTLPNISLRYKAKDGYSRRREIWTDGAAGGSGYRYTGEHDLTNTYFRGDVGLEALKMNQTIVSKNS